MNEDILKMLEEMNKGCYDLTLFNLYMKPENSFTYTIAGSSELFEALNVYGGYAVSDLIEEKTKDHPSNRVRLLV